MQANTQNDSTANEEEEEPKQTKNYGKEVLDNFLRLFHVS